MNLARFPRRRYTPAPTPVEFLPHLKDPQEAKLHALAQAVAENLNIRGGVPHEAFTAFDDYVGPGYSLPTEAMVEAVERSARLEGILLNPVYTDKTAAGLIDLVRRGHFKQGERVLFLHTGGAPALYAYQKMLGG